jgi:hypothetical protein
MRLAHERWRPGGLFKGNLAAFLALAVAIYSDLVIVTEGPHTCFGPGVTLRCSNLPCQPIPYFPGAMIPFGSSALFRETAVFRISGSSSPMCRSW